MREIRTEDIDAATERDGRVYLCGHLSRPNGVEHVDTDAYEMGITDYHEFTAEQPHVHMYNADYCYVIEGEVKVLLLNDRTERHFHKGDFFVIEPGEHHAAKCKAGTRTLFSKVPGGNDKLLLVPHDWLTWWQASWDNRVPPIGAAASDGDGEGGTPDTSGTSE